MTNLKIARQSCGAREEICLWGIRRGAREKGDQKRVLSLNVTTTASSTIATASSTITTTASASLFERTRLRVIR